MISVFLFSFGYNPKAIFGRGILQILTRDRDCWFYLAFIKDDFSLCFLSHFIHKSKFN